ncbi:Synaptic vesicle 2-related protein [Nymphon striatum]|nr:Synaptic vesicle 2-related protein [Nymphon striatum]
MVLELRTCAHKRFSSKLKISNVKMLLISIDRKSRLRWSCFQMDSTVTYTTNEAIEKMGFGKFQKFIIFFAGTCWIFDAIEIVISSILGPLLVCEWAITPFQLAMVSISVLTGMIIGSPIVGKLCDKYGRRKVIILCLWVLFYIGLLISLSPNIYFIIILRFIYGIFLGSTYQEATLGMEYCNSSSRPKATVFINISWSIGGFAAVTLSGLIIPKLGFRPWLAITIVPLVIPLIISHVWLPESMLYLSAAKDKKSIMKILTRISVLNRKPLPQGELEIRVSERRGAILDLFSFEYLTQTVVILLTSKFVFPDDCKIACQSFQTEDYGLLMTAALMEILAKTYLFVSIFATNWNLDHQGLQPCHSLPSTVSMPSIKFSTRKVRKALLLLNISTSKGPDDIPAIVLKTCAPELAPVLNKLFQL